jgi:hypothetical protein
LRRAWLRRPGREPLSDNDSIVHDPRSPYITFTVIDPDSGDLVPYGQRGQVVMNHVSRAMFLPNNLERDTAIRGAAPRGQIGDSVSEVKPVEVFGGQAVAEGVYSHGDTSHPRRDDLLRAKHRPPRSDGIRRSSSHSASRADLRHQGSLRCPAECGAAAVRHAYHQRAMAKPRCGRPFTSFPEPIPTS